MKAILRELHGGSATGYVFGEGENPPTKGSYIKAMRRIEKTIDMHGATAHIFRHTLATLTDGKLEGKTRQQILGHANMAITENIYTHARKERIASAGKIIDNIYAIA